MSGPLILLTGGTGHIGYATLIAALRSGYTVRCAVRSTAKASLITSAPSTQPFLSQLSFTTVPDILAPGAYDEAVKGVSYVIHLASPLSTMGASDDLEGTIVQPAIQGTLRMLESCIKEKGIKRVVITSSVAAVVPSEPTGKPYTADAQDIVAPSGPYEAPFIAYLASKKLALLATRKFVKEKKPSFSVVNVMPSFVIGPNELARTTAEIKSGSNRSPLVPLLGGVNEQGMSGFTCHIDDVAAVHVRALDPKFEGNRNWGVTSNAPQGSTWDDAIEIVKRKFPREVEEGTFPLGGSLKTNPAGFDATKTEREMGIKFKGFEEQVTDLARYYAEVARRERAEAKV